MGETDQETQGLETEEEPKKSDEVETTSTLPKPSPSKLKSRWKKTHGDNAPPTTSRLMTAQEFKTYSNLKGHPRSDVMKNVDDALAEYAGATGGDKPGKLQAVADRIADWYATTSGGTKKKDRRPRVDALKTGLDAEAHTLWGKIHSDYEGHRKGTEKNVVARGEKFSELKNIVAKWTKNAAGLLKSYGFTAEAAKIGDVLGADTVTGIYASTGKGIASQIQQYNVERAKVPRDVKAMNNIVSNIFSSGETWIQRNQTDRVPGLTDFLAQLKEDEKGPKGLQQEIETKDALQDKKDGIEGGKLGGEVFDALGGISFFKEKLDDPKARLRQGQKIRVHILREMRRYEQFFKAKSPDRVTQLAMLVASVVNGVAREVAREVNDYTVQAELAKDIAQLYKADIVEALSKVTSLGELKKEEKEGATDLVGQLLGADPLMLFLKGKVSKQDAAVSIMRMARDSKRKAAEMFELLHQRLQLDLGSFSSTDINRGDLTYDLGNGGFDLKGANLVGEISPKFFADLVETSDEKPKWGKDGLALQKGTVDKLAELKLAIAPYDSGDLSLLNKADNPPDRKGWEGLTGKQRTQLGQVEEQDEALLKDGKVHDKVVTKLGEMVGDPLKGEQALQLAKDWLKRARFTITLPETSVQSIFDDANIDPSTGDLTGDKGGYKNTVELSERKTKLADLLGGRGGEQTINTYDDRDATYGDRGVNYLRWRRDKDDKETERRGFGAKEMPIFGALNSYYDKQGGGKNYYGNIHFLLKDEVKQRSSFAFVPKGAQKIERHSLEAMFHDMLFQPANTTMAEAGQSLVYGILANAGDLDTYFYNDLKFEIHVYGGLNLGRDFSEVSVPEALDPPLKDKLVKFAGLHGMKPRTWKESDQSKVTDYLKGGELDTVISQFRSGMKK